VPKSPMLFHDAFHRCSELQGMCVCHNQHMNPVDHTSVQQTPHQSHQGFSRAGRLQSGGQGQRSLKRCSINDLQEELVIPTTTAAFHDETRAVGMLLQQ
jgi:hypothetical protein